ncbi:hypothetical protein [Halorussus sp. AFM4]|uniref:hypothetical protein n=1 Tax=Halorussus sp. AFM4 TaxID=3421651 RepID=UPI003EC03275
MRLLPSVALAVLLVLAGCDGGASHPPSDDRALDALNRTEAALDSVSTYRFSSEMRVSASKGDRSRTVSATTDGAVDLRNRRLHVATEVEGRTRDVYVDGYERYTECGSPWSGWSVKNLSESTSWAAFAPAGRQLALLDRTNVYWRGNETVDGNLTNVVVAYPSKEALVDLQRRDRAGAPDLRDANLKNATVKLWSDAETGLPVRSLLDIELKKNGATATARVTTTFSGYGDTVNVTVPESARTDQHEFGCPGA